MSNTAKSRPAGKKVLTDELIESGEDLSAFMEDAHPVAAMIEPQKVNVDFPAWIVAALDREADRIGVARQALIKLWIAERLELIATPSSVGHMAPRAVRLRRSPRS